MKNCADTNIRIRDASMNNIDCCIPSKGKIFCWRVVGDITNKPLSFPLTQYAHSHILKMMRAERLCITLPPRLCRRVKKEADRRQVSVSKCIADYIEKNSDADDDLVYSKEELDRRIKEAKEAIQEARNGKLKAYESAEEVFQALGI